MILRTFLGLTILLASHVTSTCFYPDRKTVAEGDVPCFTGSGDSPCCDYNSICLTNGLCMNVGQPFVLSRQSCTDKDWGTASGCNDPCEDIPDAASRGCSLPLYNYDSDGVSYYCADAVAVDSSGNLSCANDVEPFPLDSADVILDRGLLQSASCAIETVSATATNIVPSNSSSHNCTAGFSDSDSDKENVAIGAGVGVSLGVVFVASLAWAIVERRKRLALQKSMAHSVPQGYPVYQQQGYSMVSPPIELASERAPQELDSWSKR